MELSLLSIKTMKNKNYFNCVYMYVNKINNKKYIGQAKDFNKRHRQHLYSQKIPIEFAIRKYGIENFKIIILKENLKTQCLMNFFESYYIEKYDTLSKNKKGYNISNGGSNGWSLAGKTEEEIDIINKKIKEKTTGLKRSDETKKKISESLKGRKKSKEHIEKHKKSMKGKNTGENNPMYGKTGKDAPNTRPVVQYDKENNFIKLWEGGAYEVEKTLGIPSSNICCCCKFYSINCNKEEWFKTHKYNPYKSVRGFIWKYIEK